jgi:hypothetical protein
MENNKSVTAVEWLANELFKQLTGKPDKISLKEVLEQAKEMEKQQIIDSISNANKSNNRNVSLNPEQYYNETFNLSQQDKP